MNMKKNILAFFLMISAFCSSMIAQTLSVSPVTVAGYDRKEFCVSINGATDMTALQFNLSLPEGFTVDFIGQSGIKLGEATNDHTLSVKTLENGDLFVVLYNMEFNTFADGELVRIPFEACEEEGTYQGRLYNVRMSTADAVSHQCENAVFDATVIIPVKRVVLDTETLLMKAGETATIKAEVRPDDATEKTVTWETSDEAIATVVDGVVTAVAPGEVIITAKAGDKEATCVVTVEAAAVEPEPEGLSTSKYYRVKNVTTGLYLQVEGNNTNMKLQNKAEGLAMMQIFGLEDAGEGMYYIKAADADNRYYAHASGWNFNATTNADSKTPFTIALVEGETSVYTLHQSVSEYQGLAGTDESAAGSPIYCNKGIDNNGKWAFEALTAEEQVAYVATLTAAAKPALEAAIAHAEGVMGARGAVLSADEVAAINAAVATAKAEKDNTADVGVLYALTDAINAAVNEAIYVWNLDELSNEVCYAVATEERGAWYSQSENLTGTTKAGVAADITDSKQQFAFVKSAATGACYLYSVSEEKFVKVEGSNTALTEAPVQTITFLAGTRSAKYPWVVALNAEDGQKQMGISNGYDPAIITFYNDLGDGGNTVRIEKVATFDPAKAIEAIKALETGINNSEFIIHNSELIYDLTGRRVEKATKGIYIVGGKKVVIR